MNGAFALRLQRHLEAEVHQIFVVSSGPHQKQLTQIWLESDLWLWRYEMNVSQWEFFWVAPTSGEMNQILQRPSRGQGR